MRRLFSFLRPRTQKRERESDSEETVVIGL